MADVLFRSLTLSDLDILIQKSVKKALSESEANQTNTPPQRDPNQRVTRKYIKETFGVSYPTIHKAMKEWDDSGRRGLPYQKVGRKTLFKLSEVEKFFSR